MTRDTPAAIIYLTDYPDGTLAWRITVTEECPASLLPAIGETLRTIAKELAP